MSPINVVRFFFFFEVLQRKTKDDKYQGLMTSTIYAFHKVCVFM